MGFQSSVVKISGLTIYGFLLFNQMMARWLSCMDLPPSDNLVNWNSISVKLGELEVDLASQPHPGVMSAALTAKKECKTCKKSLFAAHGMSENIDP